MLLVWGLLTLWGVTAERLGCAAAALVLAVIAALLALAATEAAYQRRHAFVSQYLAPGGLLSALLSRRVLLTAFHGASSVILAFFLLIAALGFDPSRWALLLADAVLMALLLGALSSLLAGEVREVYREALARQWAARLNAIALWLAWAAAMLFTPREDFSGLRWEEVIAYSAATTPAGCDALALSARLGAVAEALSLWAAQHLFASLRQPGQVLAAWLAFLAAFGASFLVAWAYSRALTGVLARPWRIARPRQA